MSPFIIFAIVLTIAYVLYYATIITMDLNAKSKKDGEHEETISAGESHETEEEDIPQTVVEDTKTGGFSFVNPLTDIQESKIQEAIDSQKPSPIPNDEPSSEIADNPNETTESNPSEIEDNPPTEEDLDKDGDEDDTISTSEFSEEAPSREEEDELFDESKAFDPNIAQPQYAVSSIISDEKDVAIVQRIDSITQRMVDNYPKGGGLRSPIQLASEMRENREHSNIEIKDEYTQC